MGLADRDDVANEVANRDAALRRGHAGRVPEVKHRPPGGVEGRGDQSKHPRFDRARDVVSARGTGIQGRALAPRDLLAPPGPKAVNSPTGQMTLVFFCRFPKNGLSVSASRTYSIFDQRSNPDLLGEESRRRERTDRAMASPQVIDARRRTRKLSVVSIATILVTSMLVPSLVLAGDPIAGGGEPAKDARLQLPVTPAMQVALAKKMVAFKAVAAAVSTAGGMSALSASSIPASYTLSTYARHQHRWFYCGTATAQVVSNYTWDVYNSSQDGEAAATNKYKQSTISNSWTKNDVDKDPPHHVYYTALGDLINGMNAASALPFGGFYMQWQSPSWSEFQNAIATDTSQWFMPLAAGVNPRKTGSPYYLNSWASVTPGDYGHYIPLRGYSGFTQSTAIAKYNDSSGGRDEVETSIIIAGSTGAFQDLSYTVYKTMMNRYGNLVW